VLYYFEKKCVNITVIYVLYALIETQALAKLQSSFKVFFITQLAIDTVR